MTEFSAHSPEVPTGSADRTVDRSAAALSEREKAVLVSWIRRDNKHHVSTDLFISISTVNTHLTRIRAKYDAVGRTASTKAALVARALQDGLVSLNDL
jgi:DNA-binding CsgD family transcriptional regulator